MFNHKSRLAVVCLSAVVAAIAGHASQRILHAQESISGGGFTDSATSVGLRPRLTAGEIRTFLPARGVFRFPAPYSSQGVRLTNGSDCGGADCVQPVGYSYWSNINNHVGSDTMLIFLGLERRNGGGGPTLFSYNKRSGETRNLGPLFASSSPHSWSTGEGWYFSAKKANALYLNDESRMLRYDVKTKAMQTVFDVRTHFGSDKYIWQMHSSNDDRVHSATMRQSGTWEMLGCVTYDEGTKKATFYKKKGDFDECQVDKSGRWLIIKENLDGRDGEDNRIIDLQSGSERVLYDSNGAAGHSDLGYGYLLAEDNFNPQPGAVRRWNFAMDMQGGQPAPVRGQGELMYQLASWSSGLGHVAYGSARSDVPIEQQRACASNAHRQNLPRVNEIVCFPLDGSLQVVVIAPNLTDLDASGGGSDDYAKLPKGNLDVTGEYFIWTANAGTSRLDAYIVRIPKVSSGSAPSPTPPPSDPEPSPEPDPAPAPVPPPPTSAAQAVVWTSLVNATASGSTLQKTSGCGGCPDAGAISQQRITSGDGSLSFSTTDTGTLRFVGLSSGNGGTSANEIRFALRLQSGRAEVRESGTYKSEVSFGAGDTLKIAVEQGAVKYSKNGSVFYTSTVAPTFPLLVDTSLYDLNATLSNANIIGGE